MRHPVVYKERDVRVGDQVERFLRGGIGGHYDGRRRAVWRGREIGVVHEGNVGKHFRTCC